MALFKSKKQREMEAEIKFRQGMSRIRRFVRQCEQVQVKYWGLSKEALKLSDQNQFRQLAGAYLRARGAVNRWQRYLLQLETLSIRRNEVAATSEFLQSMDAMTKSIMRGSSSEQIAKMQVDLEMAMAKSEQLEQTLSIAMEAAGESIYATDDLSDQTLGDITAAMQSEAEGDEAKALDTKIDSALEEIEQQMRKELK